MVKISVIVPNYNHAKYLNQRIDTILNQTLQDFELIILDDNSEDNSLEIIDDYISRIPYIKSYYNDSNSGSTFKQWDFGVNKSNGEFIWIAESDDFAEPEFLERSSAILINNPDIGLVYCNSKIIDEQRKTEFFTADLKTKLDGSKWSNDYSNNGKREINDHLFRHNTINNVSGVLFRKSKYFEAGLADHSMKYCGDWFLYIRILLLSDIAYISSPLNTFRLHAGSSLNEYYRSSPYLLEVLRIYLFIGSHISLTPGKKITMARFLFAIMYRILLNGNVPEFRAILKILLKDKRQMS
jgi:glycosyltransferase involved in cell wall biosynthesis